MSSQRASDAAQNGGGIRWGRGPGAAPHRISHGEAATECHLIADKSGGWGGPMAIWLRRIGGELRSVYMGQAVWAQAGTDFCHGNIMLAGKIHRARVRASDLPLRRRGGVMSGGGSL